MRFYLPGAIFVSKRKADVRYKVCIAKPSGDTDCYRKRTDDKRKPSSLACCGNSVGTYHAKWRVPGKGIVARDSMRLKPENA
jgi:hypothetical protein